MLHGMPKPRPDEDTKPFWDGCAQRRLLIPQCARCHVTRWPPGPMCPACQSTDVNWIEARGDGTIYTWTTPTHPVHPVLADQVPYILALVELPEGVRILTNVVNCDPARMRDGMPVRLLFEERDGLVLPNFEPA